VGSVYFTYSFYADQPRTYELLARYGTLAVDMEAAALHLVAAEHRVRALTLLTVIDGVRDQEDLDAAERRDTLDTMASVALDALLES
jgi:purine-nucleoside phosphorylase